MFIGIEYGYFVFYIFAAIAIVVGIILLIISKKCKCIITITDKRVILQTINTIFNKDTDLETFIPSYTILCVTSSKSNSQIIVKGSGQTIQFNYIEYALCAR